MISSEQTVGYNPDWSRMLVLLCFLLPFPTMATMDNTNTRRAVDVSIPQNMLRLPSENSSHRRVAHTTHVAHPVKLAQAPRRRSTTSESPPQKTPHTTAGSAKVLDLNQIIRSLVPLAGQTVASRRSIDLDIPFPFDSAVLQATAIQQLQELGKALHSAKLRRLQIQIIGHTDAAGRADYNRKLSQQRAAAVANYLQHHFALDRTRLTAFGRGEEALKDPLHPSSAANRRVQIIAQAIPVPTEKPKPAKNQEIRIQW